MPEITSLQSGINLIPEQTSKPQPVRKAVMTGLSVARGALVVFSIITIAIVGYQYYLTKSLDTSIKQIKSDVAFVESKKQFQKEYVALLDYTQTLGALYKQLHVDAPLFDELEAITPQSIALRDFALHDDVLRLTGRTLVYEAISDFVNQLSSNDLFEDVQIVSISRPEAEGTEYIEFTLDVTFK